MLKNYQITNNVGKAKYFLTWNDNKECRVFKNKQKLNDFITNN